MFICFAMINQIVFSLIKWIPHKVKKQLIEESKNDKISFNQIQEQLQKKYLL